MPEFYRAIPGFSIRWDNIIIAIGGLLLGFLLLRESLFSRSPQSTPWRRNLEEQTVATQAQSLGAIAPAEEFLIADVARALAQTEALYAACRRYHYGIRWNGRLLGIVAAEHFRLSSN